MNATVSSTHERIVTSKQRLVNVLVHSKAAAGSFWRLKHHGTFLPQSCPESWLNARKEGRAQCGK